MTGNKKTIEPKEQAPPPKTLTEHVEVVYQDVLNAKADGYSPVQVLLGVAGRLSLNAWDFFVNTFDPAGSKAAKK